jgi:hypothetical protein
MIRLHEFYEEAENENASDLQGSPKEGARPGRPTTAPSKGLGIIFHFYFLLFFTPVGAPRGSHAGDESKLCELEREGEGAKVLESGHARCKGSIWPVRHR